MNEPTQRVQQRKRQSQHTLFTHTIWESHVLTLPCLPLSIETFFHFSPQIDCIVEQICANLTNAIPFSFAVIDVGKLAAKLFTPEKKDNLFLELKGQEDQMLPADPTVGLDFSLISVELNFDWIRLIFS